MKKFLLFLTIFLAFFSVSAAPARAEELRTSTSDKITVLPAKFELWASRGQTIQQSLRIVNDDDNEYIYAISTDAISTTGENGEVQIGGSNPNLTNLLSSWFSTDQVSGTLGPKETKIIDFKIRIPENAEVGGKYASIVISMDKVVREVGESSAVARVVSLLMVTVAGDFEDNATVLSFKSSHDKKDNKYLFDLRVRNQGINHIKPQGSIIISDLLGRKIEEIVVDSDNVLPGSNRQMITSWQPEKDLFGVYTATLVANYGQDNSKVLTAAKSFSNFPFWLTLIWLVILIISISAIIWIAKSLFGKKRQGERLE